MATSTVTTPSLSTAIQTHIDALTKANELINGALTSANHPVSKEKMLNCFKASISETISYVEDWKKDDLMLVTNISKVFNIAVHLENAYLKFTEKKILEGQEFVRGATQLESFLPENERVSTIVFNKMWKIVGEPFGSKTERGGEAFFGKNADLAKCSQSVEEALIKFGWTYRTAQNFLSNCKSLIETPKPQPTISELPKQIDLKSTSNKETPVTSSNVTETPKPQPTPSQLPKPVDMGPAKKGETPIPSSKGWGSFFKWVVGFTFLGLATLGLGYYFFKGPSKQV